MNNPQKITIRFEDGSSREVDAVQIGEQLVVNLHTTSYNLLACGIDQKSGKNANTNVTVPNCGYTVKVSFARNQLRNSPLPIRAFELREGSLTAPLPLPENGVVFLVAPDTRTFLTHTGIQREDIWSPYAIQQYRFGESSVMCATALAR